MLAVADARTLMRCTILALVLASSQSAQSATGRTAGQFGVSPTGSAQYTIPIWTPPGAGGMRPTLSIFYSHNRDNGLVGMGFDIGGFSAITRCAKTLYHDNVDEGVTLQVSDALCLDGNRLKAISGTHGAAGSEYRTALETFARVRAKSGASCPIWFEVYQRNGLIYEYGNSTTSCIDFGTSAVREWALSSIRDRAGNTITFKYVEDNPNGSYRPDEITYATSSAGGISTAPYRVRFYYETRADAIRGFWAPSGMRDEVNRLQRMEVQYNGSPQRIYVFGYTASATSGRSRLTELKECSTSISTDDCLQPTTFGWTTANAGLQAEQNPSQTVHGLQLIDVTGDGRDDMVYSSSATSGGGTWRVRPANASGGFDAEISTTANNLNYATALPINWNNDRAMELLVAYTGGNWHVLRWNGSTFDTPINTGYSSSGNFHTMDLNGDALDDLVRASVGGAATLWVRYNLGGSFSSAETQLWTTADPNFSFFNAFPLQYQRHRSSQRRADFNSDGKEDFVCWLTQYDPEWGTSWTATAKCHAAGYEIIEWSDGSTDLGGSHMYGDLNDDGMSDIVWATSSQFKILYGGASSITSGPSSAGLGLFNLSVGDYDGDGRDDVLAQSTSSPFSLQWLRSAGNGLAAKTTTTYSYPSSSAFRLAEINGDDRMDVVSISGSSLKYRLHEPPYDLLATAADGFGVSAAFSYASMTDPTVYTVGTGGPPLIRNVQYARQVVKQVTATDASGTNDTFTLTFTYQAARADTLGLGFLGFEKRHIVDSRNGLKTEETYLQIWPHTGLLKSIVLRQPNGNVVRETVNDWWQLGFTTGVRSYPYVWRTQVFDRDLNNTHFRTITRLLPGTNGAAGINGTWGIVTDVTTTTNEHATGDHSWESKTEQVTHTLQVGESDWCVRPLLTQLTNDLSIAGIPSQMRSIERTWDTASCRITQERIEPGNASWEVDIDYEFDDFGNIKKETVIGASMTPRVTQTDWGSTTGQFPETITDALGHVTGLDYDYGLGVLTELRDPNHEAGTPVKSSWTYDAFGRRETETRPDLTDTQWLFANCMSSDARVRYALDIKLRETDDGVMRTDNICFDRFDRPVLSHTQLPDGGSNYIHSLNRVQYDSLGRLSRRDNPVAYGGSDSGYWLISYDLLDRPTAETLYSAGGSFNRDRTYAYNGLSTTTQNFRDFSTTRVMTAWGDLARVTDAASGNTTYVFDAYSQLIQVSDPLSNVVSQVTYNIRGMKETSSDLDMGLWTYKHNALGEILAVRDARTTAPAWTVEYKNLDALGRPGKREEAEGDTFWTWGSSAASNNIGRLVTVSSPGYSETLTYDTKARLAKRAITISGDATYEIDFGYHAETGLLDTLTYPVSTASHRFKLQYEYAFGALSRIKRFDSPYTAYWTLDGIDPRGNVQLETLGNGVGTESTYDPLTGFLSSRVSNFGGLQDLAYQWDLNGNLSQRQDVRQSLTESFTYDSLDRATASTLTGVGSNLSVSYDAIGNITAKDGQTFDYSTSQSGCSYYGHTQRHAVRKVGSTVYCYDKNGNMEKRGAATIAWTSFNMPSSISSGTPSSQFWYGPDRERIKQVGNYASGTETTFYVGGILEKVVSSGVTRYRHRIEGPSGLIASYERPTSGPEETFYFTKDHLGSVDTITDQGGAVEARLSHDAFGARRDESDWHGAPPSTPWSGISRRGYTEHEHLDNLGLVHMNGRVQDPAIGRFLSADPNVPDPLSGQSFNRYSYVVNNPLTLIDPTGFDYWPSQREDATYNGNSVGLNDWLWVSNSIGPDVFEPQPNEEIGFYRPNTSSPNPVVEEPGPDKSSVPCDLGPCSTANPDQSPDIIQVGIDCISVGSSEVVSRANATCTGAASVRRYYSTGPGENAARAGEILLQDPNLTRGQKFAVVGAVVLAGAGSLYAAGAATVTVVGSGNTAVYLGYDAAGRIVYVGITNNIARRALEHAGRFTIGGLRGAGNLLRTEAKAVEQVLINRFGLSHQGGQLLNRINSIARSNPNYQQAIQVGTRILQELGL